MGGMFYGLELITSSQVGVLPPILGSIEAWKAIDRGRRVTFVRSRPDIIAHHLGGTVYLSNVEYLEADLREIQRLEPEAGELRLLELRHVEHDRIPFGIFEPVDGWPIRDVLGFVHADVPLAAAIALQLYRAYTGAPNLVTPDGRLLRQVLPHFRAIWRREVPSFRGDEPDISIRGRIAEARRVLATVGGRSTRDHGDADTAEGGVAFEAELTELARDVELGPQLAYLLASGYGFTSPW